MVPSDSWKYSENMKFYLVGVTFTVAGFQMLMNFYFDELAVFISEIYVNNVLFLVSQ